MIAAIEIYVKNLWIEPAKLRKNTGDIESSMRQKNHRGKIYD